MVCKAPAAPEDDLSGPSLGVDYEPRGPLVNKTMAELLALALSCDLTRVFTYQLAKPGLAHGGRPRSATAATTTSPTTSRAISPSAPPPSRCSCASCWCWSRRCGPCREGDGTLLDNCGILAASDCTTPRSTAAKDFPMLVFGSAGGRLRTGLHVRGKGKAAGKTPAWCR